MVAKRSVANSTVTGVSLVIAAFAIAFGAFAFAPGSGDQSVSAAGRETGRANPGELHGKGRDQRLRANPGRGDHPMLPAPAPTVSEPTVSAPTVSEPTVSAPTVSAPSVSASSLPEVDDEPSPIFATSVPIQPPLTAEPVAPTSTTEQPPTPTDPPGPTTTEPTSPGGCLASTDAPTVIAGAQFEQYRNTRFADRTVFDARSARWSGRDDNGAAIPWLVTLRSSTGTGTGSCWVGGILQAPWDENAPGVSWEDPYHHAGGLTIDVAELTVEGIRIDGHGDGIHIVGNGANATIRGAHLSDIHDDCIENDSLHNLLVDRVFLDGCYVAFSARPTEGDGTPDRSGNIWTIRNSLVRLEPQPTVFRGPAPGHGGFFKWDSRAPRLSIHDTVFRVDQDANHGTLGLPDTLELHSCSNNTVVWLGEGPYPAELPACFSVTTDISVWNDAVAGWS